MNQLAMEDDNFILETNEKRDDESPCDWLLREMHC